MEFEITTLSKSASSEVLNESFSLDQQGITEWLLDKNIIKEDEILYAFHDTSSWKRTGGETYGTTFAIQTNKGEKRVFIKALVGTFPDKILNDWSLRRKFLADNHIPVSNWYFFSKGVIYEEFYPKTAKGNVDISFLLSIAFKLDKLGFATLKFIDDIRADINNNPFFIDFGFDLGNPSGDFKTTAKEYLIKEYPNLIAQINEFYSFN